MQTIAARISRPCLITVAPYSITVIVPLRPISLSLSLFSNSTLPLVDVMLIYIWVNGCYYNQQCLYLSHPCICRGISPTLKRPILRLSLNPSQRLQKYLSRSWRHNCDEVTKHLKSSVKPFIKGARLVEVCFVGSLKKAIVYSSDKPHWPCIYFYSHGASLKLRSLWIGVAYG